MGSAPSGAHAGPVPGPALTAIARIAASMTDDVGVAEWLEEVLVDAAQVGPRRLSQARQAGLGEDGLRAAGVDQAGTPLDEAVGHEPIDQPGHAALAQDHPIGQLAHPHAPTRRLGDVEERVVLGERQVVLGAKVLVEAARHAGVRLEEGAPRGESGIVCCQSPGDRLGHGHGRDATPSSVPGTVRHGRPSVPQTRCVVNDRWRAGDRARLRGDDPPTPPAASVT